MGPSHDFSPPTPTDRRAPCPGLNALANHSYISHDGANITFLQLLEATKFVYNLSTPLALLLTMAGFTTCGKFGWSTFFNSSGVVQWPISWTLNLADLAQRGSTKIAHDASFVHASGVESHAPDPALVKSLLSVAEAQGGMTLESFARVHAARIRELGHGLGWLHEQVAAGEGAVAWLVMHNPQTGVVEPEKVKIWFGEEKLPKGWWDGVRPTRVVGLLQAKQTANEFEALVKGDH
ncbi:HEME-HALOPEROXIDASE domain-containing protein [Mycena chlorophos]|uniref:HEME-HALOPEROXIDASE domain-containing protein n=1 Tax=Mycena chlorophos TaxID=658473 RepID=A0A8H6TNE5_MYCCL|nr:HEME-HALOPEROXIDASE domain-containing protein [Mycena chlorophos]